MKNVLLVALYRRPRAGEDGRWKIEDWNMEYGG
jgi:hypothetical protein